MKKDPFTRVCYRLAERWGVSPRLVKGKLSRREKQEWAMWFKCHPPAEKRLDLLIALTQAVNDQNDKPIRKYMPDWGPKSSTEVWEKIKQRFGGADDGNNS